MLQQLVSRRCTTKGNGECDIWSIELRSTFPEKMFHGIETNAVGADIVNHCLCGSPGAGYAGLASCKLQVVTPCPLKLFDCRDTTLGTFDPPVSNGRKPTWQRKNLDSVGRHVFIGESIEIQWDEHRYRAVHRQKQKGRRRSGSRDDP